MNRRSFIGKALAGIVAIPLLGKLVQAKPEVPYLVSQLNESGYFASSNWSALRPITLEVCRGPVDRILTMTIDGRFMFNLGERVAVNGQRYEVVSVCNVEQRTILELKPAYDHALSWERIKEHYEAAKQHVSHSSSSTTV